jgi:hypothetical protein
MEVFLDACSYVQYIAATFNQVLLFMVLVRLLKVLNHG